MPGDDQPSRSTQPGLVIPPGPSVDDERRPLDEDVACVRCGYNLRTVSMEHACPECGAAVLDTLRVVWLWGRRVEWLMRVAAGIRWIMIASFWCVIFELCWVVSSGSRNAHVGQLWTWSVNLFVGSFTGCFGVWLLTTPDHGDDDEVQRCAVRKVTRVCMAVGPAGLLVSLLVGVWWMALPHWVYGLFTGFTAVGVYATLTYLARLARGVVGRWLAVQCRILAAAGGVGVAGFGMLTAVFEPWYWFQGGWVETIVVWLVVGLLVVGIWSWPLLWWYRQRFLDFAWAADQEEQRKNQISE